jgi:hypothetical protein
MSVPARVGGTFGLGNSPREIRVVGSADRNLREAIKANWKLYEFFWYRPALTPRECYQMTCREFHKHIDNGGLDKTEHPEVPAGIDGKCPVCGK